MVNDGQARIVAPLVSVTCMAASLQGTLWRLDMNYDNTTDPNNQYNQYNQACQPVRPNPRALIAEQIHYHDSQSNNLKRLLNALPLEMIWDAEEALADIILNGRGF